MERGEKGGVVLDGDDAGPGEDGGTGEEGNESPGGTDDASLTPIEEIDTAEPQPRGKTDPERGAEDPEAGIDDQGEEGELPPGRTVAGTPDQARIIALEKELGELRTKVNAPPTEKPKEYTEEEWAAMEQDWGVPRAAIKNMTAQSMKVVKHIQDAMDARFAKLEFNQTLDDFGKEPGFSDAARYKKEVTEFMQAYEPKHWTNPELLKRAVYYARGVNADKNLSRARNDSERNRKIAGSARPSAPSGGARRTSMPPLNSAQREAAALMEGGEAEYSKWRRNGGRVVLER